MFTPHKNLGITPFDDLKECIKKSVKDNTDDLTDNMNVSMQKIIKLLGEISMKQNTIIDNTRRVRGGRGKFG